MQEALRVAGLRDHAARCRVDLPAGGELADLRPLPQQLEGSVARLEDVAGDALDLLGHALPEEIDAGEIGVDALRREARAEVEQEQTAAARHRAAARRSRIVWIGAVRIDGHTRPAGGIEPFLRPARAGELLKDALRGGMTLANSPRGLLRHRLEVAAEQLGRARLRGELLRGQRALQLSHQVRAGDDLRPHRPHQLQRAAVHPGHRRNLVARRIVHRDPPDPAQERAQLLVARAPRCVRRRGAWNAVEGARLDGMQQLPRSALGRDQAIPAPRPRAGGIETQQAIGDLVRAAEIVEQPPVELLALQRALDARQSLGGKAFVDGRLLRRRRHRNRRRRRSCILPGDRRRRRRRNLRQSSAQEGRDHSLPPLPRNASFASRKRTLKVVSEP